MGQRIGLSFFDSKLANLAYCEDQCAGVTPLVRCYNGGYRDPNDCSKCKCPDGFGRRRCRYPAPAHGGCSPTSSRAITVRSRTEHCVSTRNYNQANGDGVYIHGDKCNWLFKARRGRKIEVRFAGPRFSIYCDDEGPSCYHWVEIKYRKDQSLRGPRFCGNMGVPDFNGKGKLTSDSNTMMVIFNAKYPLFTNSYSDSVPAYNRKGFKLCYKLAPK
ncbi:Zinc metalloproteinase nas-36 [Lamellibrachia satsuma]|nr:Zinc metalloproteinase nas-36 [Lamellibrachia satsuma]